MVASPESLLCSTIYFTTILITLTSVNFRLIPLIVVCLLAIADILWPGWDPGQDVHSPSICHQLRQRLQHRVRLFRLDLRHRCKKNVLCPGIRPCAATPHVRSRQ